MYVKKKTFLSSTFLGSTERQRDAYCLTVNSMDIYLLYSNLGSVGHYLNFVEGSCLKHHFLHRKLSFSKMDPLCIGKKKYRQKKKLTQKFLMYKPNSLNLAENFANL